MLLYGIRHIVYYWNKKQEEDEQQQQQHLESFLYPCQKIACSIANNCIISKEQN